MSGLHVNKPNNGLATWRARQVEEKRLKMLELAFYRQFSETVVRDGRAFTLVRIPDSYDSRERIEPPVQLRGGKKVQRAA